MDKASIVRDILRQWWAILLFAVSLALIANTIANFRYTPVYTTTATFVVTSRGTNISIYQDISNASDTAERFRTILESSVFQRAIAKDLHVRAYDAATDIQLLEETNLVILTVRHKSALMAYRYIRSIMDNYNTITDYIIKNVVLDVLQSRPYRWHHPRPTRRGDMMLGFLAGARLLILYVAYFSYLKDTVKNSRRHPQS